MNIAMCRTVQELEWRDDTDYKRIALAAWRKLYWNISNANRSSCDTIEGMNKTTVII